MEKRIIMFQIIFFVLSVVFLFYLVLPAPPFPQPPSDSPQSLEPGDTEELAVRRAYFTDYTRSQVLEHYQKQWEKLAFGPIKIPAPTYRLNYPPEEARTIIRDQTRSTHLEEIVHPFRESFFVNEFIPSKKEDWIIIDGRQFQQKITVKYFSSSPLIRVGLGVISALLLFVLLREWFVTIKPNQK